MGGPVPNDDPPVAYQLRERRPLCRVSALTSANSYLVIRKPLKNRTNITVVPLLRGQDQHSRREEPRRSAWLWVCSPLPDEVHRGHVVASWTSMGGVEMSAPKAQ